MARPRLHIDFFDSFYASMSAAREVIVRAIHLHHAYGNPRPPPDQAMVLRYCIELVVAQTHRVVLWRCQADQVKKAIPNGVDKRPDTYEARLQDLALRSQEETFQSARRVMAIIRVSDTLLERTISTDSTMSPIMQTGVLCRRSI